MSGPGKRRLDPMWRNGDWYADAWFLNSSTESRHAVVAAYKVTDVARTPGHNGYDLLAEREGEKLRIEVKGCTREWGIPDPFFTE